MQVIVTNDDIVVSIVSMAELVAKHFVEEDMRLSSNAYWKGYKGFTTRLQVCKPIVCMVYCAKFALRCIGLCTWYA